MTYLQRRKAQTEWETQYGNECRQRAGSFCPDAHRLSYEQATLVMMPWDGPENFYMDGEITPTQALRAWKNSLYRAGLTEQQVRACLTALRFGSVV